MIGESSTKEYQLINVKGTTELENNHCAIPNEITDSGMNYQVVFKPLDNSRELNIFIVSK